MVLHGDAIRVMSVWQTIYYNRCNGRDAYEGANLDAITATIAVGDATAQLLSIAVTDAESAPVSTDRYATHRVAPYAIASKLADHAESLRPAYVAPVQPDVCSHGVSFADICADCEI